MVVATDNVKLIGFAVVVVSDVFAFIVVAVVEAIVVVVAVVVVVVVVVAIDDSGASVTDDKTAAGDKFVNEDDASVVVVAVAFCVADGFALLEAVVEGIPTGFSVELCTEVGSGVVDAVLCFLSII